MKNGTSHYGGGRRQLWVFVVAAFFMADANALVLGDDIQVNSALGRTLDARVAVHDLNEGEAQQLKVQLASRQDYMSLGLIYPDNHKFRFQLINEPGKQAYIQVTSLRPVVDPFVDLLIETTSASGKFVRSYTVLLDPAPNPPMESNEAPQQVHMEVIPPAVVKTTTPMAETVKAAVPRRKHRHHKVLASSPDEPRQMRLSMSLSISKYDPAMSGSTSSDALQEELVAKEKLLDDLKVQISEMQLVIKDLRDKQAGRAEADMGVVAASAVSAVPAASAISAVKAESAVPVRGVAATPAIPKNEASKPKAGSAAQPLQGWKKLAATLAALLAVVSCLFWFRSRMQRSKSGPFDDLHDDKEGVTPEVASALTHEAPAAAPFLKQPVALKSDQAEKFTAGSEQKGQSIVPPEYTVLMEANKHLRAGNEDLAEAALLKAIGINPNNAYGYLALLKLYEKRGDKSSFEKTAKQLQLTGDSAAFNEAATMGRKLDPDNPLYAD